MKPILHQAIHIQFTRSYLILGLLCAVSIACCWILLALPITTMIKSMVILLVFASSTYFILRDSLLMLPWSWQQLDVDTKGCLTITNKRGLQSQPALANNSFVHHQLIILNFKRKPFKLAVPPAIIIKNSDEVRQLRVWLRWAKQPHDDFLAAND